MAVSTVKLNGTTLMTVNDTTAVASDVAQTKYFYGADGVKTLGTASGGGAGDLRSLTVTPSYDTQVFDGENAWRVVKSISSLSSGILYNFDFTYASVPLEVGETYALTGTFVRTGKSRTYTINTSVTWNGSGTSFSVSTFTFTFGTSSDGCVTLFVPISNTDEDTTTNPLELKFASNDPFDGFDVVTVQGTGSKSVTGTFTGTTTGAAMDINIPYLGLGYPIAFMIYPSEGSNASGGTYYSLIQRYACNTICGTKADVTKRPTFTTAGSGPNNYFMVVTQYKNSTTSSTTYATSGTRDATTANGGTASGTVTEIVKFKKEKTMSVYIASTSYGFAANIPYTYHIIYSS